MQESVELLSDDILNEDTRGWQGIQVRVHLVQSCRLDSSVDWHHHCTGRRAPTGRRGLQIVTVSMLYALELVEHVRTT